MNELFDPMSCRWVCHRPTGTTVYHENRVAQRFLPRRLVSGGGHNRDFVVGAALGRNAVRQLKASTAWGSFASPAGEAAVRHRVAAVANRIYTSKS